MIQLRRTQSFDHIINLVAQTLMRMFDVKADNADKELSALLDKADVEELETRLEELKAGKDVEDDDVDGRLVDVLAELSEDELKEFQACVKPAKLLIAKVCSHNSLSVRILLIRHHTAS